MMEGRILRSRILDAEDEIDSGYSPCPDAGVSIVGITAAVSSYPAVAGSFYAIHPAEVDGDPTEGGAATYVDDTSSVFYAYNLGSGVPPQGTRVICHYSGGRWTFLFNT
jgi:hypothetical protein